LHWQGDPFAEIKVVRCIRGAVYDVVADVRRTSPTFGQYAGVELSAENRRWLYVPSGCAHGYLALEDESEVLYAVTAPYVAAAENGIRWNDPTFDIKWPGMDRIIVSEKDRSWPDFEAVK
jgi:dTDP-4-dehydrorhamnose 3,5-epimerase